MIMSAIFLWFVLNGLLLPVEGALEEGDDACFERYLEESNKANLALVAGFERCEEMSNRARHQKIRAEHEIERETDLEAEREAMQQDVAEACAQIKTCEDHVDHIDFFECNAEANRRSSYVFMGVHLNSTRMLIELSDQHETAEKERIQCNLEAQRVYAESMTSALEEMLLCLDA